MDLDSSRLEFTPIQKSHSDSRNQLKILIERGLHFESRGVLNKKHMNVSHERKYKEPENRKLPNTHFLLRNVSSYQS